MDHTNDLYAALTKIVDVARNGSRNTQAWLDVIEIADSAMRKVRESDHKQEGLRE